MADDTGGKARHLGGKIKEGIGDLLGDREMERKGQLDQVSGQAEQDQARAEEAQVEAIRRKAAAEEAKNRKPL
ncbi:MAG: CsbD family protein [Gemmatimonadetes bacterium]|nr:CsbD family protein [Gemmatimonadota bacterium]